MQSKFKFFGFLLTSLFITSFCNKVFAQLETSPVGGNAMASARDVSVPVNNYTGVPSISVPLFSYAGRKGLSLAISLDYFSGGIRAAESPSSAGLGWNLRAGGAITRTIRGIADDQLGQGYLYRDPLTDDERTKVLEYGNGCFDGEQDIYQININGISGNFYIGKNHEIITTPGLKVKITVLMDEVVEDDFAPVGDQVAGIRSFQAVTSDGVKYLFDNIEYQTADAGCTALTFKLTYGSAWYISKIVAPYSTDTIAFAYTTINSTSINTYPQTHVITSGLHSHIPDTIVNYEFQTTVANRVPLKISFPDSTYIDFVYSKPGQFRYATFPVLQRIKFSDTAFRYGYVLKWDTTNVGGLKRDFLMGLNYYTPTRFMPGYEFNYTSPYFPLVDGYDLYNVKTPNKRDHWGFYNGLNTNNSRNTVATVAGVYTANDRTPNSNALASSLASLKDPSGGTTYYKFENNDVLPVTNSAVFISINGAVNTSNSVTLTGDHSKLHSFVVSFDYTFGRSLTLPISGAGNLIFTITSSDGLTTHFSTGVNLKHLYYNGSATVEAVIPNGNYLIKTSLESGTSSSIALPIYIAWNNQAATGANSVLAGGIRIKQITHYDPLYNKTDTLVTYRYVTADGKSSGIGGQSPVYNFTRTQLSGTGGTVTAGSISQCIVSDPGAISNFADPGFVGYKRVEVYRGSLSHNLGKEVYEYTGSEGYVNTDPAKFPFLPKTAKEWAAGLLKRTLVYDSLGNLIKTTLNTYTFTPVDLSGNINYRSIKNVQVSYGNVSQLGMERVKHYTGKFYYPQIGRVDLTASTDTFYHPDASYSSSRQLLEYDSNYNLKKLTTDYDKTRGLSVEKRFYYSNNYNVAGGITKLNLDGIIMPVSSETWIVGDGNPRIIAGEITNYASVGVGKNGDVFPAARYVFESNKPIIQSTIGIFDSAALVRNNIYWKPVDTMLWEKASGNCLQVTEVRTGLTAATIYGYKNKKLPVAKVTNAEYRYAAYSSFETTDQGGWTIPAFTPYLVSSITGKASYPMAAGTISKNTLNAAMEYLITYWAKSGSAISISNASPVLLDSRNGWNFYSAGFTGYSTVYISGSGYLDELRFYPKNGNMITTTYNEQGQVSSICDANNSIAYNYYDSLNRIKLIRDMDMNILKKYEYPADHININLSPGWVATSPVEYECEKVLNTEDNTGMQLKSEWDNNFYSESYQTRRKVPNVVNTTLCPLPPPTCDPDFRYKLIGGICEMACKEYISSTYSRVTDPLTGSQVYKWVCTWRYKWSNNSVTSNFIETNDNSCSLTTICEE